MPSLPATDTGSVFYSLDAHGGGAGGPLDASHANAVALLCGMVITAPGVVPVSLIAGMVATNPALIIGPYEKGPQIPVNQGLNRIDLATLLGVPKIPERWYQHSAPLTGDAASDKANRVTDSGTSGGLYAATNISEYAMNSGYVGTDEYVVPGLGGAPAITALSWPDFHWQDVNHDLGSHGYNMLFMDNCKYAAFNQGTFVQFTGATVETISGVVYVTVPSGPFSSANLSAYSSNPGQIQFQLVDGSLFTTTIVSIAPGQHTVAAIAALPSDAITGAGQIATVPWDEDNATDMAWDTYQQGINSLFAVMQANLPSFIDQANCANNADQWYRTGALPSGSCNRQIGGGGSPVSGSTMPGAGIAGQAAHGFENHCQVVYAEAMFRTVSSPAFTPTSYPNACCIQNDCQMALDIQAAGTWLVQKTRLNTQSAGWSGPQIQTMQQILTCLYMLLNRGKAFVNVSKDNDQGSVNDPSQAVYVNTKLGAPTGPSTNTISDNLVGNATSISTPGGTTKSWYRRFTNGAILAVASDETPGLVYTFDRPYVDVVSGQYIGTTYTAANPATTPVFLILQTATSIPVQVLRATDGGIRIVSG